MKKLKDLWIRYTDPDRERANLRARLAVSQDVTARQNNMIHHLCKQVGHLKSELAKHTTVDKG